jgi:tetratricopeptide (TPR) repeat protein
MNSVLIKSILLIFLVLTTSCGGQDKKDAADFFLKGNVALKQKNFTEAIRLYDEAIDKNHDFPDAYLNKGIALMKIGKINDAREVLTEAIGIDPTLVQANLVRSESGLLLGEFKSAEEDLKKIAKEYADSSSFFLLRGNLMDAMSRTSEALADFDRAVLLDKQNTGAYVNRGAVYYKLHSYPEAREDFASAIRLNPSQPEALNNLGLIATHNKDWKSALFYFDRILDSRPDDALALNNKGYVLLQTGSLEEAKKLIERALDINPKNGYALRNLGLYYQFSGQQGQALAEYNKAIELAEPVDYLYGYAGQLYFSQNDKDKACGLWRKGIILKDSVATAAFAKNCR